MSNPFELFNLPITLYIDEKELQGAYQQMLAKTHPDIFTNQEYFMQQKAKELSEIASNAYQTLLNPTKRAKAAILAKGWNITEDNAAIHNTELLSEIINYQENANQGHSLQLIISETLKKLDHALHANNQQEAVGAYYKLNFLQRHMN